MPGCCIYHHTHRFVERHQYLALEPPNDFAHWVSEVLGEKMLAEKLLGIDTVQHSSIRSLREAIISTIEEYLADQPHSRRQFAGRDEEFHFVKSISIVTPTPYTAGSLKSFVRALETVSTSSIYFHMFEARLRLEQPTNDFSWWLESSLGEKALGDRIAAFDPYSFPLERLREKLVTILTKK